MRRKSDFVDTGAEGSGGIAAFEVNRNKCTLEWLRDRGVSRLASICRSIYGCCMIEDVRHHLEAGPFEPFAIVTSSGHRHGIPSPDHAGINPRGNRVVIWFDDGGSITLSALHITAVEKIAGAKDEAA